MDDNIHMEPNDHYMLKGQSESDGMNQGDLLNYQMTNQQVPSCHGDSYFGRDDLDKGLNPYDNQSSFIPSHIGKEVTDSSLSDSRVGHEQMLFDQGEGQQADLMDQGQPNAFQPDLLCVNPLSLESTNGHKENDFEEDLFASNDLSKMTSAQQGCQDNMPSSQPPDLLMMESTPGHISKNIDQNQTSGVGLKESSEQENKEEAIENDFYNPDEQMDDYDDEYVDSEESDYSDYSDDKDDEGETRLEQIVPEVDEKHVGTDTGSDQKLNNHIDPNIGASGSTYKNVHFDDQLGHSDEENENVADKGSEMSLESMKKELSEGVASGYESDEENETATEQQTNFDSDMCFQENTGPLEKVETNLLETKPEEFEGLPKQSAFGIESDSSDLEERSLTPDPNQMQNLQQTGSSFQDFTEDKTLGEGALIEEPEDSGDLADDELTDVNRNPSELISEPVNTFDNENISMQNEQCQSLIEGHDDFSAKSDNIQNSMDVSGLPIEGQGQDFFNVQNQIFENNMEHCAKTDINTINHNGEDLDLGQPDQGQPDSANVCEDTDILKEERHESEREIMEDPISSEDLLELPTKELEKEELMETLEEEAQPEKELKEQILMDDSLNALETPPQIHDIGMEETVIPVEGKLVDETQNDHIQTSEINKDTVQDVVCDEQADDRTGPYISQEDELLFDQMKQPGMAGLLVENAENLHKQLDPCELEHIDSSLDKGEIYEEKDFETEKLGELQPDMSKEDEILYSQTKEPGMGDSLVLDQYESLDDRQFETENQSMSMATPGEESFIDQTSESGVENSNVLEEDKTFDDKKIPNDEPGFEQSDPEMSSEDEMPTNQKRESGMEGSFVLEEGETLDDKKFESNEPEHEDSTPEDEIPSNLNRESGMEGSFVLEEGQTFEDKDFDKVEEDYVQSTPEISPDGDLPSVQPRETGMQGSFVLEEGETLDDRDVDNNQEEFEQSTPEISPEDEMPTNVRESGMEGSFVLEEGQTFEDKNFDGEQLEFEQSTPEVSPEDEIPNNQIRESGMEGSLVLEEGQTFENKQFENGEADISPEDVIPNNQMRESGMEGSFVLEEGQTFDDKQFGNDEEEFVQSTPETTPEDEIPDNKNQLVMEDDKKEMVEETENQPSNESALEDSIVPAEDSFSDRLTTESEPGLESLEKQEDKITQEVEEPVEPETPVDSYEEEGDMDSSIQSPLSQNGMIQSPSSDVNEAINVQQENEKNLMSSSLIEDEAIETYQPCVQNGISHSESEDASPQKEEAEPPYYQNGISQSASEEFTPEKEIKINEDLIQKEDKHVSICEQKPEVKEVVEKVKKSENLLSKKTATDAKKTTKEIPKKKTQITKVDSNKKEVLKDTKKDTLSKLPSPTKQATEKRSVSASRTTRTPPSKSSTPTTRMARDTTRKSRPPTTDPSKPLASRPRPKSIDISRTSSLTRPTASSLNKTRTFEKATPEGATSPTKPFRSSSKTTPSRYRIPKTKKDGSDSGVEEEKTPRKPDTPKVGQHEKMTRSTSAKRSTIPTMNKTPTKSEGSPKKTTGKTTPTRTTQSKIGSLDNARHTPGGGQVKIQSKKPDFSNVTSRIGSKDQMDHKPAGGDKKILSKKLEWKAESKVGSLKNATYAPGGGKVKIENKKLDFKEKAQSKVGSKDYITHKPGGGDKKIESQKLDFKEKAHSKVGSKDNIDHKPLGGDKKIDTQKLTFKESAKPRTDTGVGKTRPDSGIECEKMEASV